MRLSFNFDTLARAIAPKKTKNVKATKVKKVLWIKLK